MKRILYIVLMVVSGSANAQTLDEYLVMAADSNARLKAKFLEYRAALEQVPQAGALPDPEVSFGYFISPVETRVGAQEARFSAMQMFPWFGTLGVRKNMKTEMAKAKFEMFNQVKSELFYEVKKIFYKLYELQQSIKITEDNLKILKTYESVATSKFENGKAGMVDVLRIQMEMAELENKLLFLKDKNLPLKAAFNQYLNRDVELDVFLPDTIATIEILLLKPSLMDSIILQNDYLTGIKHLQSAAEYSVQNAQKMAAPSFGVGANYVLISERTDVIVPSNGKDAFMPMLSIKLPIYKGKNKSKVKEAQLNFEALENTEIDYKNKLRTDLEIAWTEYTDAKRRVVLYQKLTTQAKQAQNILIQAYGSDGKDFEEVLRVQRMLLNYKLEIIKSVIDSNTAVAKIESLM